MSLIRKSSFFLGKLKWQTKCNFFSFGALVSMIFCSLAHWLLQNICFPSAPDFSGGLNVKIITLLANGDDDSKLVVDHSC